MKLVFLEREPQFVGGSERMSLALCRHAVLRGHQTWLVHPTDGDMVAAYTAAGATCVSMPVVPMAARRPVEAARSFLKLAALVRRERIDVIFTSLVSYVSLIAAVGRATGARSAVHLGLVYDFPSPLFRAGMRRIDVAVAPSDHTADGWRARDWPARSLRVIENGVDTATFNPGDGRRAARKRLGVSDEPPLVAYVGRLVVEKGILTLLRAFARLWRTQAAAQLLFVGRAPHGEVAELKSAARAEGLPDEAWHVRTSTSTPEDVYRAADIVVCPSEWDEPFGLTPIEAAACGTLTLVSDRGILPRLVAPLNGQAVFPAGNIEALDERLLFWLRDGARRESAASQLREFVNREFGFARCGDAYLDAFQAAGAR